MSVKIGHASIDENKKINGGQPGDQTGKEVCIRDWYAKDWDVLLRPKSKVLAENSASICEKVCKENKTGYHQKKRNSLYRNYVSTGEIIPTTLVETDCSAFMTYCAKLGGANIVYGTNAPTTSDMREKFVKSGNYEALTDKKYLTSPNLLKRGDILVSEGHHTVMVLTNGNGIEDVVTKVTSDIYPKCDSKYQSIVDALVSVGENDTSLAKRKKIAKVNGIGVNNSFDMNVELLNKLKKGELLKA